MLIRVVPVLSLPSCALRESFLEAAREPGTSLLQELSCYGIALFEEGGFEEYLAFVEKNQRPQTLRFRGWVPATEFWWTQESVYLGRITLRHGLTPPLRRVGGHIGYEVRPRFQNQGHAKAMLAAVLPHAYALGVNPALLTCDEANVASRRVIEANGGVLAQAEDGKLRYWMPTR